MEDQSFTMLWDTLSKVMDEVRSIRKTLANHDVWIKLYAVITLSLITSGISYFFTKL